MSHVTTEGWAGKQDMSPSPSKQVGKLQVMLSDLATGHWLWDPDFI